MIERRKRACLLEKLEGQGTFGCRGEGSASRRMRCQELMEDRRIEAEHAHAGKCSDRRRAAGIGCKQGDLADNLTRPQRFQRDSAARSCCRYFDMPCYDQVDLMTH